MPRVLRVGSLRFYFYSGDRNEPRHIHVASQGQVAKFWLDPIRYHGSKGFSTVEIRRIERIIHGHAEVLIEAWNDHFDS